MCTCGHIASLHHPDRGCLVTTCPCGRLDPKPKANKYGAVKVVGPYGELYDSKAERDYARVLTDRFLRDELVTWSWAPRFVLQDEPLITYRPDFVVWGGAADMWIADVKGHAARDFSLRARLWRARFPDVPLCVVKNGEEIWQ